MVKKSKKPTIADIAKKRDFKDIFIEIEHLKQLNLGQQDDINIHQRAINANNSRINRLQRIASTKRRMLV